MGKNKGEMKYHALKETLKNDILSGIYQPGDKIPSENQLVQEYDLSRHTVRKRKQWINRPEKSRSHFDRERTAGTGNLNDQ